MKRPPAAAARRKLLEVQFSSESVLRRPLSLLTQAERIMEGWGCEKVPEVMQKNRALWETGHDWVQNWCRLRRTFFDDGLRFPGRAQQDWLSGKPEVARMVAKLNADLWTEWLINDNAAVFWMAPQGGSLPRPIVLDGESCEYHNGLGGETLKLKLQKRKLEPREKQGLTPRWIKAYETEGCITLDPGEGEHFAVLTRAKAGKGFGMPRLRAAYRLLGNLESLQIADTSGAIWHRDVIQSVKAGHEIKNGELAGQPNHFLTKIIKEGIEKSLKPMRGAFRNVRQFDIDIDYDFLDPKFFDAAKYTGTLQQLDRWGGAAMLLLASAQASPFLLTAFAAEGRSERAALGGFLDGLLSHEDFLPDPPADPLRVVWNPHTFRDGKSLLEGVRLALGEGLASRQTGREILGFDHEEEGDRLEAEEKAPVRNRPGFEPKQGMLSDASGGEGRPKEKPGDA